MPYKQFLNNNVPRVGTNNARNLLLNNRTKRLIIIETEKIDDKLILVTDKNVDKKEKKNLKGDYFVERLM